jgi:hypothetical protein
MRRLAGLAGVICLLGCASAEPPVRLNLYWEAVARRIAPGTGDEEKAIAIAHWVSANSTNQLVGPDPPLVPFYGRCGHRATVFLQLARRAGLEARRVQFERFGDGGHAAAEVRYGGGWHYFDVTYAGYFRKDGEILSFDEIRAAADDAIEHAVVFEFTHDHWSDGRPVDNRQRMRQNYTPERIRGAVVQPSVGRPTDRT